MQSRIGARPERSLSLAVGVFLLVALGGVEGADGVLKGKSFTNSLGMRMVRIDAGSFSMGSEKGGDFDERPVHQVTIRRPFYLAETEVTNAAYEKFDSAHRKLRGKLGFSRDDDEAVVFVSWYDATRFCKWLSEKEDKPYRLPTEAEWEYACRAGTTSAYSTGDTLPAVYRRYAKPQWTPVPVPLHAGRTPPNPWGLLDMHGNVEEWCLDGYGPYDAAPQVDPVGRVGADFKVTRGGSHSSDLNFLRSANRMGTLPEDKHFLIGFRVVQGELAKAKLLPPVPPRRWARGVRQERHDWKPPAGYDPGKPYFKGPVVYVKIPPGSRGPLFSEHNHQPGITACPNGDLLAIWYTCNDEPGRELAVAASRLRRGSEEWEPADPFWDAPDRNDHGSDIWWDGKDTLYHFNGLSTDIGWAKLALVMRTSTDNGATWSKARLIGPEHELRHQVIAGAFQTREGFDVVKCDAVSSGSGGSAIHVSRDRGATWVDPGAGKPRPSFKEGGSGAWIAGIHAGVCQRKDGSLLALGRGDAIQGRMPKSISRNLGESWTYSSSGLPRIGGGQRLVLLRLREGPLFLASFARGQTVRDAAGKPREIKGLFAALSFDGGKTWPLRRPVTDGGPARTVDGGGNTGKFTLSATSSEPKGYMAGRQTPDGIIHLISSKQYYAFNLAWLKQPMPAAGMEE